MSFILTIKEWLNPLDGHQSLCCDQAVAVLEDMLSIEAHEERLALQVPSELVNRP